MSSKSQERWFGCRLPRLRSRPAQPKHRAPMNVRFWELHRAIGTARIGAKQPVLPTEELWQLRLPNRTLVARLPMSRLGRKPKSKPPHQPHAKSHRFFPIMPGTATILLAWSNPRAHDPLDCFALLAMTGKVRPLTPLPNRVTHRPRGARSHRAVVLAAAYSAAIRVGVCASRALASLATRVPSKKFGFCVPHNRTELPKTKS